MAVIDNCLFYQGLNQSYAWQGVLQSKGNSKIAIKGVLDAGRIRWPNPHIGFVGNWEDTVHQGQSAWRDVSQYNNSTWTLHHLLSHRALKLPVFWQPRWMLAVFCCPTESTLLVPASRPRPPMRHVRGYRKRSWWYKCSEPGLQLDEILLHSWKSTWNRKVN